MSFLDKLKKGMGIEESLEEAQEESQEESQEEIIIKPAKKKRIKAEDSQEVKNLTVTELRIQKKPLESEPEEIKEVNIKPFVESKSLIGPESLSDRKDSKEKLFKTEGQLTIDVYQTETHLIIQSAIAGINPENLDITMERDIIIIRGNRKEPQAGDEDKSSSSSLADARVRDYFIQECYWGAFSRQVILPVEVDPDRTEASMKQGVLTIRMPKILREKKRSIEVKG